MKKSNDIGTIEENSNPGCERFVSSGGIKKSICQCRCFLRGRERIRTAVQGFADLCLTARPRDQTKLECKCRETGA